MYYSFSFKLVIEIQIPLIMSARLIFDEKILNTSNNVQFCPPSYNVCNQNSVTIISIGHSHPKLAIDFKSFNVEAIFVSLT